jgi:predicted nuclease of predicted toxin-antitoxin system
MKVLLDECLPLRFRHCFPGHEVHSVDWAGLKGKKNGELLRAADQAGYDVLLTVDQGIPRQLALRERKIAIVVIRSRTNQVEDLMPLVPEIVLALSSIQAGGTTVVPAAE